jgi:replicative DNA helicase
MLLHREDYYRKQLDPDTKDLDGLADIVIAKQRNGPTGISRMTFIEEYTRFVDYSNDIEED